MHAGRHQRWRRKIWKIYVQRIMARIVFNKIFKFLSIALNWEYVSGSEFLLRLHPGPRIVQSLTADSSLIIAAIQFKFCTVYSY